MKRQILLFMTVLAVLALSCNKDKASERFTLLTSRTWASDSLLADGADASGPGQILEKFKGDVRFNEDGTGTFGQYTGTWAFADNEESLAINSPDLPFTLTTRIIELKATSLKVTFTFPGETLIDVRMTFRPK